HQRLDLIPVDLVLDGPDGHIHEFGLPRLPRVVKLQRSVYPDTPAQDGLDILRFRDQSLDPTVLITLQTTRSVVESCRRQRYVHRISSFPAVATTSSTTNGPKTITRGVWGCQPLILGNFDSKSPWSG